MRSTCSPGVSASGNAQGTPSSSGVSCEVREEIIFILHPPRSQTKVYSHTGETEIFVKPQENLIPIMTSVIIL